MAESQQSTYNPAMKVKDVKEARRFSAEKMQKVNLFESPRMFCDLYCLEPGQKQALHSHDVNDKIYYVVEGEARVTVGEETRDLGAGQITCAFAGEPHGVENAGEKRVVCLVFMAPHPSSKD